ncbi:24803_t:CDS:2, partial [Gigaspora rosea]
MCSELKYALRHVHVRALQVGQVDTPSSKVANGANVVITWTYTAVANQMPGILSCIDNTTKNTTVINSSVDLASKSYRWTVNIPAGTYYLALNDGGGDKYSGTFSVFDAGQPIQAQASSPTSTSASTPTGSSTALTG